VEVTFDDRGIAEAECSCPVGEGGRCKHVVALLLTWLDRPESFRDSADLEIDLEERSKSELIALIYQMVQRYPDLEYLLKLPPTNADEKKTSIDPDVIHAQVRSILTFSNYDLDWGDLSDAGHKLDELINLADQYLDGGNLGNAAVIYRIICEEILAHGFLKLNDNSDRMTSIINDCVEGLEDCLKSIQEANSRQDILKTLFNILLSDINMGGYGLSDEIPYILVAETKPAEETLLIDWIKAAIQDTRSWGREILGGLLLDLQEDSLDDEAYLEICRQTGRVDGLIERLLQLGRVEEAILETQKVEDYRLPILANIFVEYGFGSQAEGLIRKRSETSQDDRLKVWLKEYFVKLEDFPAALKLMQELFWQRPLIQQYRELKETASQLDTWEAMQSDMIEKLSDEEKFNFLVEIYLEESQIDQALTVLEKAKAKQHYFWEVSTTLELQVAQAAEKSYPLEAIRIYHNQVISLINQRGRGNYAAAADYLREIRRLYQALNRQEDWNTWIAKLRQENKRLPALQEELNKAGF
jgi:uncharacterized Zn finger protein